MKKKENKFNGFVIIFVILCVIAIVMTIFFGAPKYVTIVFIILSMIFGFMKMKEK